MYKIYRNKKYKTIALYACAVIAIATLIGFLLFNLDLLTGYAADIISILNSLVLGLAIAYLLNPLVNFYERTVLHLRRKRMQGSTKNARKARRFLAITFTVITVLLILSVFVFLIVPQIVNNFDLLKENISKYVDLAIETINKYIPANTATELVKKIEEALRNFAVNLGNMAINYSGKLIIGILNTVLGIIIALYILFFKEELLSGTKKFFKAILSTKAYPAFADTISYSNKVFGQFIRGKIIDSTIVGFLLYLSLLIVGIPFGGIPFSGIVSLFVAASNIIPYFGPFIGAIPSFLLIFMADPIKAFIFLVVLLIVQQLDANFIDPKIVGDSVGLSALWVITAVTVFGGIFGILGMFLAVPIFTVVYNYVKKAVEKRLEIRGLPQDTVFYSDMEASAESILPVPTSNKGSAVVPFKAQNDNPEDGNKKDEQKGVLE